MVILNLVLDICFDYILKLRNTRIIRKNVFALHNSKEKAFSRQTCQLQVRSNEPNDL